jgi:hypothetical protein
MRNHKPKNIASYQNSEEFSGRPDVANAGDRAQHREKADPDEFAAATAHENERNISRPEDSRREKKQPQSVKPDQPVTTSKTRKSDDDVGGF